MKQFKQFMSVLFFVVLATTLVSCKSTGVVPPTKIETTKTITKKEVIRDTIFEIQKDSSYYRAYLECVNGKVVVKEKTVPLTKKGNYLQPPKVNIQDNIITVDCNAEAQKLFAQWKETYTEAVIKNLIQNPYIVEKELSGWQITQIYLGRLFLFLVALLGLGFAFKNRI